MAALSLPAEVLVNRLIDVGWSVSPSNPRLALAAGEEDEVRGEAD